MLFKNMEREIVCCKWIFSSSLFISVHVLFYLSYTSKLEKNKTTRSNQSPLFLRDLSHCLCSMAACSGSDLYDQSSFEQKML